MLPRGAGPACRARMARNDRARVAYGREPATPARQPTRLIRWQAHELSVALGGNTAGLLAIARIWVNTDHGKRISLRPGQNVSIRITRRPSIGPRGQPLSLVRAI